MGEAQDRQALSVGRLGGVQHRQAKRDGWNTLAGKPPVNRCPADIEQLRNGGGAAQTLDEVSKVHCRHPDDALACRHFDDKAKTRGADYCEPMETWLQQIIEARKRRGLSVIDVAATLGVHRAAVHRWEKGERFPDLDMLRRWGMAVGVQVDLTVTGETEENRLLARLRRALDQLDERAARCAGAGGCQESVLGVVVKAVTCEGDVSSTTHPPRPLRASLGGQMQPTLSELALEVAQKARIMRDNARPCGVLGWLCAPGDVAAFDAAVDAYGAACERSAAESAEPHQRAA